MIGSLYMKPAYDSELESQIAKTVPGMAHFAGSGPLGKRCGDCKSKGYHRHAREVWDEQKQEWISRTRRVQGCAKFFSLTGSHGPDVPKDAPACKYFEQRAEGR